MMLIATTVAIALVASTAFAAGATAPASTDTIPPMIVTVTTAADL